MRNTMWDKKWNVSLIILFLLIANAAMAQEFKFKYQRTLEGVNDTWHTINIPTDAYSKLNSDFSDVRIIGILANGDTIEVPYILKTKADKYDNQLVDFSLINQVKKKGIYYYTFKLRAPQVVNTLELSFNKANFDWLVTLEGSHNQQEWFTILEQSRIVGIKNKNTSYKYTTLEFKEISYAYLRIKLPSKLDPQFKKATMEQKRVIKGLYNSPAISSFKVMEDDKQNETNILVSLNKMMPISFIKVLVTDSINYYRPIKVEYAIDSIKNNTGWHYLYKHLFNATLSSLHKAGHNFSNQVLKHIKITIDNKDNEPLNYAGVKLHGNPHHLITRFSKPATYYLVYGNAQGYVPTYDITRFQENIPATITALNVGQERRVEEEKKIVQEALFTNSIWLWVVMITVILLLGWFSIKMLKN